ncbi:hypothetical protein F53441_4595 [Fusarium austroafricanum]|uniref:Uncharacterized protein n=1 Tax=Fusarium austroafricanum TaxID=2364996 RepID=A0A8H4KMK0_9HYPO|nr:hypothetical protein F53441_4595 [Fusarium austroafricanum]
MEKEHVQCLLDEAYAALRNLSEKIAKLEDEAGQLHQAGLNKMIGVGIHGDPTKFQHGTKDQIHEVQSQLCKLNYFMEEAREEERRILAEINEFQEKVKA